MKNMFTFPALVLAVAIIPNLTLAQSSGFAVAERGADYRIWQKTGVENGTNRVLRYVELATGMYYTNASGQLMESKEQINILPDGTAAATQGRHQAYFPADIYEAPVRVVTPDGLQQQSQPLGLFYDDGVKTVLIAAVTHSVGQLVGNNRIIYTNAFVGVDADIQFTYRKSGVDQDVVLRSRPPSPADLGLNPGTTRLEMVTEFFGPNNPVQKLSPVNRQDGLSDATLTFGKMQMVPGRAILIGADGQRRSRAGVRTYKSWLNVNGRKLLIEALPLWRIKAELEQLQASVGSNRGNYAANSMVGRVSRQRLLPPAHLSTRSGKSIQIARVDRSQGNYVLLDYNIVDQDQPGDFTFEANSTYLIAADVYISGTTTFGEGTVLKFPDDGSGWLYCGGSVICEMTPFNPAFFTSENDNSVGDSIGNGNPGGWDANYLFVGNNSELKHCRFSYAGTAVVGSDIVFNDVQLAQCYYGIVAGDVVLNNVLASGCNWVLDVGDAVCDNCTFDSCAGICDYNGEFTNCIFSSITSIGYDYDFQPHDPPFYVFVGSYNEFYNSPEFGDNVVTGSIVDAGSTTADRLGLYWWTTQGPIEGTTIVDLGYHYPAVDANGDPISTLVSGVPDYVSDANGDGLPDDWEMNYFGDLNHCASDQDPNGNTLLYYYQNAMDPNAIDFTVRLGNQHFNTTTATGQFLVLNGMPGYQAVLVNDANLSHANWQPYDGNISMNLGPTDGVYQVTLGLKGFAANAQPVWVGTATVYLDRVAPPVAITNPTNNTVATPYIQLQGYATEELLQVTFGLSNAVSTVTNQLGFVTKHCLDNNAWEFTTNFFQCYDILLTNGLNCIALHATDLAGNVTTTNLNVTLNYAVATNPAIRLTWPQDGMQIVGGSFTLRGWTEDASATVTAQIADTNGDTNVLSGVVERTGVLWVENLPLAEGTNTVTLWVTNSAGLSSETNISVVKSDMTLALTSINGDLWMPTVSVSGVISDPNAPIWVNGVQGTNYGNGTWSASGVPVSAGGVASFDMSTTPPNGPDPGGNANVDKDTKVVMESATWNEDSTYDMGSAPGEGWEVSHVEGHYTYGTGGIQTEIFEAQDTNQVTYNTIYTTWDLGPDGSIQDAYWYDTLGDSGDDADPFTIQQEEGAWTIDSTNSMLRHWHKDSTVKMTLLTGGKGPVTKQVLASVNAGAAEEYPFPFAIPPEWIAIPGLGKNLGTDGWAYGTAEAGTRVDVTPTVGVPMYMFDVGGGADALTINANGNDLSITNPEFCVGQLVTFVPDWSPRTPPYILGNSFFHWHLPDKFVNEPYEYWDDPECDSYWRDDGLLANPSTSCWYVNGSGGVCSVGMNLAFSNGQNVSIAAVGNFTIFRPKAEITSIKAPFYFTLSNTNPLTCELQLGDSDGDGCMNYWVTVDSQYAGSARAIQLVTLGYSNPCRHSSDERLDGTGDFNSTPARVYNNGGSTPLGVDDGPFEFWEDPNTVSISARDFVQFCPDGGGNIYVTLGIATWNASATARQYSMYGDWFIQNPTISGPFGPDASDTFPVWMNVAY